MDLILLKIFAFLRPIGLITLEPKVLGLSFLDLAGILLLAVLMCLMLWNMSVKKHVQWTGIDTLIFLYALWCIAGFIAYPEKTDLRAMIKWLAPYLTYIVAKNSLHSKEDYFRLLFLILLGFVPPLLMSVGLIATGEGISYIDYHSKLPYYDGAFDSPHTFGHAGGFVVILGIFYFLFSQIHQENPVFRLSKGRIVFITALMTVGAVCIYLSVTRTVLIGVAIFLFVYLYRENKKLLFGLFVIGAIGAIVMTPTLLLMFRDVVEVIEGERPLERIGSGRPWIWMHNLTEFSKLSFDRQLIGAGIGNRVGMSVVLFGKESFWSSHNDFLDVFIQTGIVGFVIYFALHVFLLIRIIRLKSKERTLFLALFVAVAFMNLVSNSYLSRYGFGQLFFMILAYLELRVAQYARVDEMSSGYNLASSSGTLPKSRVL